MKRDYRVIYCQILNLADGLMTLVFMKIGADDADPSVKALLSVGFPAYALVKFFMVALCVQFLDRRLEGKSRRILTLLVGVLGALCCYHWAALLYLTKSP